MNSPSNVMMLVVTYVMMGIYGAGFNQVDVRMYESSMHIAKKIQCQQIAESATAIASVKMGSNKLVPNFIEEVSIDKGIATITANRVDALTMKVTSVTNYYNEQSTIITTFVYRNGRWKTFSTYSM